MNLSEFNDENFEDCPPRADAIIHSLRAFGYDLGMAIADLIDNSISAGASNIWVSYSWNNGDPWIRILDDGEGMTEGCLFEAMRLGTRSPLEKRDPADLGRFGLGLKTASFSQAKVLTVFSKTEDGTESARFWDLDAVQNACGWKLGKVPKAEVWPLLEPLRQFEHGTLVLWQNLDRTIDLSRSSGHNPEDFFLLKFLSVKQYLEMVFHQYLENWRKKLKIYIGVHDCEPWDPYLRANDFTQELSSEKYEDNRVSIIPYVLPHVSKRTDTENTNGCGPKGWNAQQGFYVYRNKRMIVSGGYLNFDLKAEEHCKLARIRVDITNDMDQEWSIDVRKAVAIPPDRLKSELLRIAKVTRQRAAEVYRARTGAAKRRRSIRNEDAVWLRKHHGEKIIYKLNEHHPVLKKLIEEINPPKSWLRKLFYLIETTVPHRLIIMDGLEYEDCHVDIPDNINAPPSTLIDMCGDLYRRQIELGRSHSDAVDIVCCAEPFDSHPAYRAYLDGIIE